MKLVLPSLNGEEKWQLQSQFISPTDIFWYNAPTQALHRTHYNFAKGIFHKMVHFPPFFVALGGGLGLRTALGIERQYKYIWQRIRKEDIANRMASSNTLFRFLWVKAEHSKYLWALISFAMIRAWSYDTGSIRFCLRLSNVAGSSLKSNFVPTRIIGTDGAWWSISGNHYAMLTLAYRFKNKGSDVLWL